MNLTLSCSSELMTNYVQASVMDPDDQFEALQDSLGNALLFSIGTDGVFYVTRETPALANTGGSAGTANGWDRLDLSSVFLQTIFTGGSLPKIKAIAVNQDILTGTIGLAMVATEPENDTLYICMGNAFDNTDWLLSPQWVSCPFNYSGSNPPAQLIIEKLLISETQSGQFIVTDILNGEVIQRYYLLPGNNPQWNLHALPVDLSASTPYTSCIGRNANGQVDGMYTFGQINGAVQFVYCPLYNIYGRTAPSPTILNLPAQQNPDTGNLPEAMAAFRNGNADQSSDLFVTSTDAEGNGWLYYFNAQIKGHEVNGVPIFTNALFAGALDLYASLTEGVVTLWGLDNGNNVFYTTCPYAQVLNPGAWSLPVPLASGVDMVSPYVNLQNNGNTIFAVGGNDLFILIKSPETGIWNTQQVMLPQPAANAAQSFVSYTTRIQVMDENNQPVPNTAIEISASSRAAFYANNLYTVLGTDAITLTTDVRGVVTLIEVVNDLAGTTLNLSAAGMQSMVINPMDNPVAQIGTLNTPQQLSTAMITNNDGSQQLLIPAGTSAGDLQTLATANGQLAASYQNLPANSTTDLQSAGRQRPALVISGTNVIVTDAGDIFRWLETGVESFVQIVKQDGEDFCHFVATIGGVMYADLLDAAGKIAGAFKWLYQAIKTAIGDLLSYLKFLFGWQDICTTHNVIKNIFTQFVQNTIDSIDADQSAATGYIESLIGKIDNWANFSGLPQTMNGTTAANPPAHGQNGAPANLGTHHFQGNVGGSSTSYAPAPVDQSIFQDLINLLENEGDTLMAAAESIKTNIIDQIGTLTIDQLIKNFLAIVADTLLRSAENIISTTFDVIKKCISGLMDILTQPIDFPVLSTLYQDITGDELTFLDLFCFIAAIPATIVYKLIKDTAPFPADQPLTQGLIAATDFQSIRTLINGSQTLQAGSGSTLPEAQPIVNGDLLDTLQLVFGFAAFVGAFCMVECSIVQTEVPDKKIATISALANILYVSPNIPDMLWVNLPGDQQLNGILTDICILKAFVIDVPFAGAELPKGLELLLNYVWFVPVIENIIDSTGSNFYSELIPQTIGNCAFNAGGMLTPFIEESNPDVQIAQYSLMGIYGAMMVINGFMYA